MYFEEKLLGDDWRNWLLECWNANIGLTTEMLKGNGMNAWEWDDNYQMAYEAFHKAVLVYRQKKSETLLSIYRMTLKHSCWQVYVNHKKSVIGEWIEREISPEDEYYSVLLWERVYNLLGEDNTYVYEKYFIHEYSFSEIGKMLGVSRQATRKRVERGNVKLKADSEIQGIAEHFGWFIE